MCIKTFEESGTIVQKRYNKLDFRVQKHYVNNPAEGSKCVAQPKKQFF